MRRIPAQSNRQAPVPGQPDHRFLRGGSPPAARRLAGLAAALAVLAVLAAAPAAASAAPAIHAEDVTIHSAGATLHGTVLEPAGPQGPRPGIVLVHGSGQSTREDLWEEAEAFARAGVVTLAYDKRTDGYTPFQRDFSLLAGDALAAVQVLRDRAGVDPSKVGAWGLSEGGWVAPLAAARSDDIAFLITAGASARPPERAQSWALGNRMRHFGMSGSILSTVPVTGMRVAVGWGLFGGAGHDPVPVLEQVDQPVLAIWGGRDTLCPPQESARIFTEALARGGNRHVTVRAFPDAHHNLHTTPDGFERGDDFAPGYLDLMTAWVDQTTSGHAAASSTTQVSDTQASSTGVVPPQARQSAEIRPLAWYESRGAQAGAHALFLAAFAGYPLTAATRRLRGLRGRAGAGDLGRPPARWPARTLAAAGLVTTLAVTPFVIVTMTTAGQPLGPVVAGRPLPWLLLQLLAVAAVVSTATLAVTWWRTRRQLPKGERARLLLLLAGGAAFIPWALWWGLLLP